MGFSLSSSFLNDIPKEAKVFIYGAGKIGMEVFRMINRDRRDVEVLGFIDTFRSAKGILSFDDFKVLLPDCDLVVVASAKYWKDMENAVRSLGYRTIVPFLYRIELSNEDKEKIEYVKSKIKYGSDVYENVIKSVVERNLAFIECYYSESRFKRQYLDFIDFESVEFVIEGGVYNGRVSKKIIDSTCGRCVVFGFEIWGDRFLEDSLRDDNRLKLFEKALWDKRGYVYFYSDYIKFVPDGAFVVEEQDELLASGGVVSVVEAVSIDEFVAECNDCKRVDYIKLDVEGAEEKVINGAKKVIRVFRPQMAISVYHEFSHYYEIPISILNEVSDYILCFEHYGKGFSDSVMYFIRE